jgi:hypothetical protein
MVYYGPVRPTDNEQKFRDTGKTTPAYQGPVRPTDNEQKFRDTGSTVRTVGTTTGPTSNNTGSSGKSNSSSGRISPQQKPQQQIQSNNNQSQMTYTISSQLQSQQNQQPQRNQSVATLPGKPQTREQELSTKSSFGGAVKKSARAVMNFGTIGQKGLSAYSRDIFSPFNEAGLAPRGDYSPNLFRAGGRGTEITGGSAPPSVDRSKLSMAEIGTLERIESRESLSTVGMTTRAAKTASADRVQRKVSQEVLGIDYSKSSEPGKSFRTQAGSIVEQDALFKGAFNEQLGAEYSELSGKRQRSDQLVRNRQRIEDYGSTIGEGVKIGAVALASTTPAGATITGQLFRGTATKTISQAILDDSLSGKQRAAQFGMGALEFASGTAITLQGVGQTPRSMLSRQNVKLTLKELEREQFEISGRELARNEFGSLFKVRGARATSAAKQEIDLALPAFDLADDTFRVTGGRGVARTKGYDFISGKDFSATQNIGVGARGQTLSIVDARATYPKSNVKLGFDFENTQAALGSGYVRVKGQDTFRTFKFGGLSKETPEGYAVASFKPSKLAMSDFERGLRVRGRIDARGTIERLPQAQEDGYSIILGGGRRTPFQTQSMQTEAPVFAAPLVKQAGKDATRVTLSMAPRQSSVITQSVSAYAGLGQYERTSGGMLPIIRSRETSPMLAPQQTVRQDRAQQIALSSTTNLLGGSQRSGARLSIANAELLSFRQPQAVRQGSAQASRLRERTRQDFARQMNSFNFPKVKAPFSFGPQSYKFRPWFDTPKLPNIKSARSTSSPRGRRPNYNYLPSFTAAVFNIRGKSSSVGRDRYGELYGVGTRGLLNRRTSRPRRRKR